LEVLEPGAPPVPLIVLPFESVLPVEPLAPLELAAPPALPPEPPELCATAKEKLPRSRLSITANNFMTIPSSVEQYQWRLRAIVPKLAFLPTNSFEKKRLHVSAPAFPW
jgi:hypothetical protein